MFEILRPYRSCGWDFDDTLVGHPHSEIMWRFIVENPFDQEHHIVTMRTHGWQDQMFPELALRKSPLLREHFQQVINCPDPVWLDHQGHLRLNGCAPYDHAYHTFKGEQCALHGIEVLIDDMESGGVHRLGCERHDIVHIHPDDLL